MLQSIHLTSQSAWLHVTEETISDEFSDLFWPSNRIIALKK